MSRLERRLAALTRESKISRASCQRAAWRFSCSDVETARVANNYAMSLIKVQRFEEVKTLLRRTLPVARRVLGKYDTTTLASESIYAEALYGDPSATLGDVREAVTMLEELVPTARRVFGGAHPTTVGLGAELKLSRAALRAREAPPTSG